MKVRILKANRKVKESPYLTACKERDGILGNIEMNHYTNVDDVLRDSPFRVDPGSNLKRQNSWYMAGEWKAVKVGQRMKMTNHLTDWNDIADELNKPGVFDKLAKFISSSHRGQK